MKKSLYSLVTLLILSMGASAQDFTFDDFVGTWYGTISGEDDFGTFVDPITMIIFPDGFYTETTGHLMPTIYPNSQQCQYDAQTNRMHWWYIYLVYSGMNFYTNHYYEVVYFSNDTLEMHYNFWDDPEPYPEIGTIFLVKENLTPAPSALDFDLYGSTVVLSWDEPASGNGSSADPDGYNVYHKLDDGNFELLAYVTDNAFAHEEVTAAGWHAYQVTAVYDAGESDPSNVVQIEFTTPAPENLFGYLQENTAILSWEEPDAGNAAMAGLIGYHVFHKEGEGEFELLDFVQYPGYYHYDLNAGVHAYHVTATYDGGESLPSNEIQLEMVISDIADHTASSISIYPNPSTDKVHVNSSTVIQTIFVISPSGKVLMRDRVGAYRGELSVTDFNAGLYIIGIEDATGKVVYRRLAVQ